eukprot:gene17214-biopygen8492
MGKRTPGTAVAVPCLSSSQFLRWCDGGGNTQRSEHTLHVRGLDPEYTGGSARLSRRGARGRKRQMPVTWSGRFVGAFIFFELLRDWGVQR